MAIEYWILVLVIALIALTIVDDIVRIVKSWRRRRQLQALDRIKPRPITEIVCACGFRYQSRWTRCLKCGRSTEENLSA